LGQFQRGGTQTLDSQVKIYKKACFLERAARKLDPEEESMANGWSRDPWQSPG
jgi:hypothetical protein